MIDDVRSVFWKEWRELLNQGGRGKLGKATLAIGLLPGLILPLQMGRYWLETPMALASLLLIPPIVSAAIVDSVTGERERHTLETLLASRLPDRAILYGKLAVAIAFGWLETLGFALPGLLLVNLVYLRDDPLFYSLPVMIGFILTTPILCLLIASFGAIVASRARTVRQASLVVGVLTFVILPTLIAGLVGIGLLAVVAEAESFDSYEAVTAALAGPLMAVLMLAASLLLGGLAVIVLGIAQSRYQRTKLALD